MSVLQHNCVNNKMPLDDWFLNSSSLMIGVLVSGSRDLGSKPGWVKVLCTGEKHYIQTVPLQSGV